MRLEDADWVHVDPTWPQCLTRWACWPLMRLIYRLQVHGSEHVPQAGGALLCPNHASFPDPVFFSYGHARPMRVIGKQEVFRHRLIATVGRRFGGFPVRRGQGDAAALQTACEIVQDGQALLVFMEGTFSRSMELLPPRSGAALLALWTGCAVVPGAAWGNNPPRDDAGRRRRKLRLLPRVTVVWREPLRFEIEADPSRQRIEQVRGEIWEQVRRARACAREIHEQR